MEGEVRAQNTSLSKPVEVHVEGSGIESTKVIDGDLALQVLHTHYESYTAEEEKRLLRKIDIRLALLMLFVNGIQFVDKLVCIFSTPNDLQF